MHLLCIPECSAGQDQNITSVLTPYPAGLVRHQLRNLQCRPPRLTSAGQPVCQSQNNRKIIQSVMLDDLDMILSQYYRIFGRS
jgi:hypothetical protein